MFQRAYTIRLYPTELQEVLLSKTFGSCRKVHNCMLEAMKKSYEETGKFGKTKPSDFYLEFPFLKEVDSQALASEKLFLKAALKTFIDRKAVGVGFPKFKAKHRDRDSYSSFTTNNNIRVEGAKLRLPKIGFVSFRNYRDIDWSTKVIKHVTVSRSKCGKYYASLLAEEEAPEALPPTDRMTALDMGLSEFCTTSDGEVVRNPRFLLRAEKHVAALQRVLSNMQKGSNRREAMRKRIAAEHEHIRNQRKDFADKLSTRLIRENQTIVVEDLDVKGVAEGEHSKSEHDTAWRLFLNKLEYKALWYGRTIVRVGRWFPSSQLCHCCGYRNPELKDVKIRSWTCPQCGQYHERDYNAALNILAEGKRIIAGGTPVQRAGNCEAATL